ncbi:MAG: hypothetical protein ACJAV5_000017 [Vicingaceae bacterium]|jgi:hypothetical protein
MHEFKCEDLMHQPPINKKQNYDEKNNVKYGCISYSVCLL